MESYRPAWFSIFGFFVLTLSIVTLFSFVANFPTFSTGLVPSISIGTSTPFSITNQSPRAGGINPPSLTVSPKTSFVLPLEPFFSNDSNPVSGSFGSFNQRIAQTEDGFLIMGLRVDGFPMILSSSDGGDSWKPAYTTTAYPTTQPPAVFTDNQGSAYAFFRNNADTGGCGGILLRFDKVNGRHILYHFACVNAQIGTKWSARFDNSLNRVLISRRSGTHDLSILQLSKNGIILAGNNLPVDNIVENATYPGGKDPSYNGGQWDLDTQYHTFSVGPDGDIHLFYNVQIHNHPTILNNWNFKTLYLRSVDNGKTWLRGTMPVATPFPVDDFTDTAQVISYYSGDSTQAEFGDVQSIIARGDSVHLLYNGSSGNDIHGDYYVRLNRFTGEEESRQKIQLGNHAFFIDDPVTNNLYIFGQKDTYAPIDSKDILPVVYKSSTNGDSWHEFTQINAYPSVRWDYFSGLPTVSTDGYILAVGTDRTVDGAIGDTYFFRVKV